MKKITVLIGILALSACSMSEPVSAPITGGAISRVTPKKEAWMDNFATPVSTGYTGAGAYCDLAANDVIVERSVTGTYYCTVQFDVGYTGIQAGGSYSNLQAIFSVWDPSTVNGVYAVCIWTNSNTWVTRFGGEGDGVKCELPFNWSAGKAYRSVVRSWDNGVDTFYQGWICDVAANVWMPIATIQYPGALRPFTFHISFLEDFIGTMGSTRSCWFNNSLRRTQAGVWMRNATAQVGFDSTRIKTNIYAAVSNNAFYVATGGAVPGNVAGLDPNRIYMSIQPDAAYPGLYIPTLTIMPFLTNTRTVNWSYGDPQGYPQFAYQVQVATDSAFTAIYADSGKVVSSGASHTFGGVTFPGSGRYYIRVKTWNLYETASEWVWDSFLGNGYVSVNPKLAFRGTPNAWGTTAMALVDNYSWETRAVFSGATTERFKFDLNGDWAKNWGDNNSDGIADANGSDIYIKQGAGAYTIRFNDQSCRYSVGKSFPQMYVRGTFNAWGKTAMNYSGKDTWKATVTFGGGATGESFKFDANGDWAVNWGDNNNDKVGDANGGNIAVAGSATYEISFNDQTKAYSVLKK